MSKKEQLKKIENLVQPYRIRNGKGFRLDSIDPGDTHGLASEQKQEAKELLATGTQWLSDLQCRLYADDRWSVLVILQAMDAAGKDGTIKHVMSGVNPQGCQVFSFKQPSAEDLDHDFMWRYFKCMPERGRIGIFNRSYYEEVLVVRVHDLIKKQKLPKKLITADVYDDRLDDICAIERYLQRNGVLVLKFFLHLSKKEQKRRFLDRIERPEKHWKFSTADMNERQYWKEYQKAFEAMIQKTSTKESPWYVVPADNKWFSRLVVAAAMVEAMEKLDLSYPDVTAQQLQALEEAKIILEKS